MVRCEGVKVEEPNNDFIISSFGGIWLRWIRVKVPCCIGGPYTSNRDMGGSNNSRSVDTAEYCSTLYPEKVTQ